MTKEQDGKQIETDAEIPDATKALEEAARKYGWNPKIVSDRPKIGPK